MESKCKFLVRITIILTALYFMLTYILAQFFGIAYFNDFYVVLLELCLCVFCSVQGNYHCKYIRYTAWGLFVSDMLTRLDNEYDFLSVEAHNLIPACIIFSCILLSSYLAISHFIRSTKINNKKKSRYQEYELRQRN